MIDRLTIVGVGLIGGSLGLALKKAGAVREVVGVGRSEANLAIAKERGIVNRFTHDPLDGVKGADLVFLSVPVESIAPLALAIRPALKNGAVVTDGGSTKVRISELVRDAYGYSNSPSSPAFVPGHPVAGTENSGAAAAKVDLFKGRRVILTPTGETPKAAVATVRAMWEATGAQVDEMTPVQHDRTLAAVSHLPHAAAFALVNAVAGLEKADGASLLQYAAGGFLDITRIASSDPAMWRDIFLQNRDEIRRATAALQSELGRLDGLVERRDAEGLMDYFSAAKATRDSIPRRK